MRLLSFIIGLTTLIGCSNSIEKNDKLIHAINDTSISIRGNLIKIAENDYRYDYYDVTENDSHSEYLQKEGFLFLRL